MDDRPALIATRRFPGAGTAGDARAARASTRHVAGTTAAARASTRDAAGDARAARASARDDHDRMAAVVAYTTARR